MVMTLAAEEAAVGAVDLDVDVVAVEVQLVQVEIAFVHVHVVYLVVHHIQQRALGRVGDDAAPGDEHYAQHQ